MNFLAFQFIILFLRSLKTNCLPTVLSPRASEFVGTLRCLQRFREESRRSGPRTVGHTGAVCCRCLGTKPEDLAATHGSHGDHLGVVALLYTISLSGPQPWSTWTLNSVELSAAHLAWLGGHGFRRRLNCFTA